MKLHQEDPRLTAHVLGELGPEESADVESAVAADPALQAELEDIRGIRQFLTSHLETTGDELLPSQLENIRRVAQSTSRSSGGCSLVALRDILQPWLIPAAAAAVLAIATVILFSMPHDSKKATAGKSSKTPASPPAQQDGVVATAAPSATNLPESIPQGSIKPADFPSLELPVLSAKTSLELVSSSIRKEGKAPPSRNVRLGEILNNFPLRLNGVTSIARSSATKWHPDNRDSGMSNHVATLSTELVACPWKPSARLLIVSIKANAVKDTDIRINFLANPDTVLRYRLLGFSPVEGQKPGELPTLLPAGSVATLAIEIEPSKPDGDLAYLEWSTNDTTSPPITIILNKDTEPSDDARFAALVCTFAEWLTGSQPGMIDSELVAALARETTSSELPPERVDFLNLIDKSLHL
jgi:hypothetical protein